MAYRFAEAGANALVLFNRFYQPDFDLDTGNPSARAVLSRSEDLHSALRWVALLSGRVSVDFAVTGGVHTHEDVLKAMLASASVAQVASELLEHGPGRLREILADVTRWLEAHEQPALAPLRGRRSLAGIADPAAWERTSYAGLLERSYPSPPAAT
jgi:dihydroorotate dehydrogenase (fumarate)